MGNAKHEILMVGEAWGRVCSAKPGSKEYASGIIDLSDRLAESKDPLSILPVTQKPETKNGSVKINPDDGAATIYIADLLAKDPKLLEQVLGSNGHNRED